MPALVLPRTPPAATPGGPHRATVGALLVAVLAATLLVAAPATAALPVPKPSVSYATPPEAPSQYFGQVSCDPTEKPGAKALRDLLRRTYGKANTGGITRACSVGGRSEHKEGRAYDWALNAANSRDKAMADSFIAWATGKDAKGVAGGNAHRLGIQYVIWNKRIWNARSGWKAYTGASPHTDHVHISLSWDGAFKRTSFWTGKAVTKVDHGPCQPYVDELAKRWTAPNYTPCPPPAPRIDGVVSGDFDGDGRGDQGTYHGGVFVLRLSTTGDVVRVPFGQKGDRPVAGDWDGDGVDGIGVFRSGTWLMRETATSGPHTRRIGWGMKGDHPFVGDWDGDGVDGVGVFRPSSTTWYVRSDTTSTAKKGAVVWGRSTDRPAVGDFDGDGRDSLGLYRSGVWLQSQSGLAASPRLTVKFGHADGFPAVGDWNGDGIDTLSTIRVHQRHWTNDRSGANRRTSAVPY